MQNKSIKDFWCFFPFDGMTVEPSGNVKPCPIWCTDEDHLITDLKLNPEQTVDGIFETSKLKTMRSHMKKGIPLKVAKNVGIMKKLVCKVNVYTKLQEK